MKPGTMKPPKARPKAKRMPASGPAAAVPNVKPTTPPMSAPPPFMARKEVGVRLRPIPAAISRIAIASWFARGFSLSANRASEPVAGTMTRSVKRRRSSPVA